MSLETILTSIATFVITIGGAIAAWKIKTRETSATISNEQRQLDARLSNEAIDRNIARLEDYAKRLEAQIVAQATAIKEIQSECEREKQELRDQIAEEVERRAATDQRLARMEGFLGSVRGRLQKIGIFIPQFMDDSAVHKPLQSPLPRQDTPDVPSS